MSNWRPPPKTRIFCPPKEGPEECSPSLLPRPTGFCKRYARNIPQEMVNPDPKTGIRRKMILPPLSAASKGECEEEKEADFREVDCKDGYYDNRASPSGMPWSGLGRVQSADDDDPVTKLSKLIQEETEELESSKMYLQKALFEEAKIPKSYRELVEMYKSGHGNDETILDSELQPELAAQLLQSEEQGETLKHIPPAALYGRLFRDDRSIPKIMVTAASKRRRGVVIPVRAGMQQDEQILDDLDAGVVDYYEINAYSKPKDSKPIPSPIKHEAEGDADQILGLSESNEIEDEERKPFKYIVTHEPPLHGNYAQLRGSETPIWFPGFFTVNPGVPELQTVEDSSDALEKAWESMNPTQVGSPYGNILLGKNIIKSDQCQ